MRWFWIDRFIEFESGSYAKSVKNVTLAEEHLHDHFPGFPVMPGSLMIEGLAQTGGILLDEINEEGGAVDVTAMVGDRLVAEGSIIFVHLDQSDSEFGAIDQKNFVFSMNLLGILDVGKAGTGEDQP